MPIAAIGGAPILRSLQTIRLARHGCANRYFWHIIVTEERRLLKNIPVIEQLGTYDAQPNMQGERLCSLNLERLTYWIGRKAIVDPPVSMLLGLAGYLPIHPTSYRTAWRARAALKKQPELAEKMARDPRINPELGVFKEILS